MSPAKLIPSTKALELILASMPQMGSESLSLSQCRGRVLFEDIDAGEDIPKHANSSMDGFAVLDKETAGASESSPRAYQIAGESSAGSPFDGHWEPAKQTVRIMTGAIVPPGANAVIELEQAFESNGSITLKSPVPRGKNIRLPGEDVRRGERVLSKGTVLGPEQIGALASLGFTSVGVSRKPSVAVITTGSELVDPDSVPAPGMVRNSSIFMIPSYVEEAGGTVASTQSVGDDLASLKAALTPAFDADVVMTTGGVSVGKYDLVQRALKELDVEVKLAGVNIKPGKPLVFGVAANGTPVFGLPGNPVSSAVTFWRFVRPAFEKMMGSRPAAQGVCRAILEEEIVKKDEKEHFLRGVLTDGEPLPSVRRIGIQSSGALSSMARATCLIVLPAEARTFKQGETVEIQLL